MCAAAKSPEALLEPHQGSGRSKLDDYLGPDNLANQDTVYAFFNAIYIKLYVLLRLLLTLL